MKTSHHGCASPARGVLCAMLSLSAVQAAVAAADAAGPYANPTDGALAGVFEAREKDWRNGAVVYQVLVDRFAPSARLEQKRSLYAPPKMLRDWDDAPRHGTYDESIKLWTHEIEFWGGDLDSLMSRLDYVHKLGADVLYLNPIHFAYTNHKYDALDYNQVSPEFGSREDLKKLAADVHLRGMKLVLDGVFNHVGRKSKLFEEAQKDANSPVRDWFYFGSQYPGGVRTWARAQSLPELNLENPKVRDYVYAAPDSVVQGYLADGIDGWRLDVAFDIGFAYLAELTQAAHKRKPGSLVLGEIANYPKEWYPSVDGVLHFVLRQILIRTISGEIDARPAQAMLTRMIDDAGIDNMLKSWVYLDNHDTQRIRTVLGSEAAVRMAQVLQFTLPGSPNIYYGSEVGMQGGADPEMRAPMRWDWVRDDNMALTWTRKLIALHKQQRALRVGNYRPISTDRLIAFERYTDRVADSVFVLANPGKTEVTEFVMLANSKVMNNSKLLNLLDKDATPVTVSSAMVKVSLPAGGTLVLAPDVAAAGGYTPYKRVQ